MLDGLGLAETTPGPLILVTEFVGFLAAFRQGGGNPWAMGTLGAIVTLWATFAPCFLWIFAGAPYIERLNAEPKLKSALAAVTAAVVGVILNLTVWFGLHVLFASLHQVSAGPLALLVPDPASLSLKTALLAAVAALLLFVLHRGILTTLAVCAALALGAFAALVTTRHPGSRARRRGYPGPPEASRTSRGPGSERCSPFGSHRFVRDDGWDQP